MNLIEQLLSEDDLSESKFKELVKAKVRNHAKDIVDSINSSIGDRAVEILNEVSEHVPDGEDQDALADIETWLRAAISLQVNK